MNNCNSDELMQFLSQFLEQHIRNDEIDVVVVDTDNYKQLLKDSAIVQALQCGGVDNWEHYDECMTKANDIYDVMLNDTMKHKIEVN